MMADGETSTKSDNIDEVKFSVMLSDLKNFTIYKSAVFFVRGNPWTVEMRKTKNKIGIEILTFSLSSNVDDKSGQWAIVAVHSEKIISYKFGGQSHQKKLQHAFHSKKSRFDIKFIQWNQLVDPANGYVKNDTCKIKIKVRASELQKLTENKWITFETIHCCDRCSTGKFRIKINNIEDFFGSCFLTWLNTSSWEISICRSRNLTNAANEVQSDECLYLNLGRHNKALNVLNRVSILCKLISSDPKTESKQSNVVWEFSGMQSYASSNLLTWNDLVNPQNQYIQNDSITIEVDMKVETVNETARIAKKRPASDSDATNLTCFICLEGLIDRSISSLLCGHMFCTVCIENSLQQRKCCPICNGKAVPRQLHKVFLPLQ